MGYLEAKALHIFFVISWFAGLFYLPRIFVNLAMVPAESTAERERLLLMSRKLYRFVTPIGVLSLLSGLWLWLVNDITGSWLYLKLVLVFILVIYHLYCRKLLSDFEENTNQHDHRWYRWFNETPAVLLVIVTYLVIFKPFQ